MKHPERLKAVESHSHALFAIGDLIHHRLFDYRGVVYDVDPVFCGTEEWYAYVARSRPAKDRPWYRVLVDNSSHETYVAEQNLEKDLISKPIRHPAVSLVFERFENGLYIASRRSN